MQTNTGRRSATQRRSPEKSNIGESHYGPAPICDGERAALLQWAHCYWQPDALTAYAETDGWEGCADLVLRDEAVLRHVIWIGIHVRRRSCREAAEDLAKIAVRNDIWRARYISLAQTFSEDIGRWAPGDGDMRLTTIWREARDRYGEEGASARKPPTLADYRAQGLARFRRRKSLGEFRTAAMRKFRRAG